MPMVFGSLRHSAFWLALTETPRARHRHDEDKLGAKAGREDWAWRLTVARTVAVGIVRCLSRLTLSLLAVALCGGSLLLLLLSFGMLPAFVHLPVELFYWPQPAALGGAGFPPPSKLQVSQLLNHCPAHRPKRAPDVAATTSVAGKVATDRPATGDEKGTGGLSIRREPRWILHDLPCLNASHLDAGVCIAARTAIGVAPTTMRCLPSFIVLGAQKAGSTDLRGLLSFHPSLDGPSSEVRFFSHLSSAAELHERWREYLDWFPEWPLPSKAAPLPHSDSSFDASTKEEEEESAAVSVTAGWSSSVVHARTETFTSRGAHQWTYEKSPAYLGSDAAPQLAHILLPSVKLLAILRNPTPRAYSAFQHHCRFGRWRRVHDPTSSSTSFRVVNCGAEHDVKFEKRPLNLRSVNGSISSSSSSSESGAASSFPAYSSAKHARAEASAKLCKSAPPLTYPCRAADFHQLMHAQFGHLANPHHPHPNPKSHHHHGFRHQDSSAPQQPPARFRSSNGGGGSGDDRNRLRGGQGGQGRGGEEESGVTARRKRRRALNGRRVYGTGAATAMTADDHEQASISHNHEFASPPRNSFSHQQGRRTTTATSPPLATLLNVAGEAGSIVTKGLYAHHLRSWLKYFPPTQLKVIVFEDFYSSGTDESIARVTRWLGVPTAPITQPLGYRAYNWYNGAQRARNHYETMQPNTRNLLDSLFCDHNQDLATLVNALPTRDDRESPTLLPRHGYACVD